MSFLWLVAFSAISLMEAKVLGVEFGYWTISGPPALWFVRNPPIDVFTVATKVTEDGHVFIIKKIFRNAFKEANVRKIVFLRDSQVEEIEGNAFFNQMYPNPNKFEVYLPPSIRFLHKDAIDQKNTFFLEEDGKYYIQEKTRAIFSKHPYKIIKDSRKQPTIRLRKTLTRINDFAYINNNYITTVIIPTSVKSIGDSAFYGCVNLRRVSFKEPCSISELCNNFSGNNFRFFRIPSSVKTIRNNFSSCSFEKLEFAKNSILESIECSFFTLKTKKIEFPSSLKNISSSFNYCRELHNVTFPDDSQLESGDKRSFSTFIFINFECSKQVKNILEKKILFKQNARCSVY